MSGDKCCSQGLRPTLRLVYPWKSSCKAKTEAAIATREDDSCLEEQQSRLDSTAGERRWEHKVDTGKK